MNLKKVLVLVRNNFLLTIFIWFAITACQDSNKNNVKIDTLLCSIVSIDTITPNIDNFSKKVKIVNSFINSIKSRRFDYLVEDIEKESLIIIQNYGKQNVNNFELVEMLNFILSSLDVKSMDLFRYDLRDENNKKVEAYLLECVTPNGNVISSFMFYLNSNGKIEKVHVY